ncbi:hypothetical protein NPX13_g1077 [Xylaria arbuscula]|uniref:Uncharacterized protein n=1 Tax=Xylaria arbuscula TaxID=114810 RepID=A0A9W8TRI6_9PEZI|nr:hypothetical protein NPX13_g1077 [Xylaria arbuscula]
MSAKVSYTPLKATPTDEATEQVIAKTDAEDEWSTSSNIPTPARRRPRIIVAIKGVAIVLLLVTFFILGRTTTPSSRHRLLSANDTELVSVGKCSPDWKEAEEAGCVYDLVLSTWMHPRCFDKDMYEKYKSILLEMDFKYWREPEMINEVSLETAETGRHAWLWTDGRYHHLHCAYALERIQVALMRDPIVLDTICRSDDREYSYHLLIAHFECQMFLLRLPEYTGSTQASSNNYR